MIIDRLLSSIFAWGLPSSCDATGHGSTLGSGAKYVVSNGSLVQAEDSNSMRKGTHSVGMDASEAGNVFGHVWLYLFVKLLPPAPAAAMINICS